MGECCTHCSECDRKKVRDEKEYKDLIRRLSVVRIQGCQKAQLPIQPKQAGGNRGVSDIDRQQHTKPPPLV